MVNFNKQTIEEVHTLFTRYPRKLHALLPVLHLAQRENNGWLPPGWDSHVAELCETSLNHVRGVMTFYNMFKHHPVGRFHIMVCTCVPCGLCKGMELLSHLEKRLGIHTDNITEDGLFSLEEAQCLAACDRAPLMMINQRVFGPLSLEAVDEWIEAVRRGESNALELFSQQAADS